MTPARWAWAIACIALLFGACDAPTIPALNTPSDAIDADDRAVMRALLEHRTSPGTVILAFDHTEPICGSPSTFFGALGCISADWRGPLWRLSTGFSRPVSDTFVKRNRISLPIGATIAPNVIFMPASVVTPQQVSAFQAGYRSVGSVVVALSAPVYVAGEAYIGYSIRFDGMGFARARRVGNSWKVVDVTQLGHG